MADQRALQSPTTPSQQPNSRRHVMHGSLDAGAYTITKVLERIDMARSTFYRLQAAGELPFLEEVKPRLGKRPRFRADLVEQYVANTFNREPLRLVRRPHSSTVTAASAHR